MDGRTAHDDLVDTLAHTSDLSVPQIQTLVATAVSLAASFWQLGHAALDFEPRLTSILQAPAIRPTRL